jgi:TnpA family transposase
MLPRQCAVATTVSPNTLPHSATDVLERFGSAARGDRVYRAGHALGQLLRTVYLCDELRDGLEHTATAARS